MKPSSLSANLDHKSSVDAETTSTKGTNPLYDVLRERRASHKIQPKNTRLYEVEQSDTVASIAARFNITPSELVILNKLGSRTIFPSQIIYVPDVAGTSIMTLQNLPERSDSPINGKQQSPKQSVVKQPESSSEEEEHCENAEFVGARKSPSAIAEDQNKESMSKFLKINAKNITDGEGVVSGVLLVTPNHLMFDPNVSDPLVIEHGLEKYGVVAPIHMVVRTGLYSDIVRMRVKGSEQLRVENDSLKLYHSKRLPIKKSRTESNALYSYHAVSKSASMTPSQQLGKTTKLTKISECLIDTTLEDGVKTSKSDSCDILEEVDLSSSSSEKLPKTSDVTEACIVKSEEKERPSSDGEVDVGLVAKIDLPVDVKKKSSFEKTRDKLHKGLLKLPDGLFNSAPSGTRRMSLPISASFQELKSKVLPTNHTKKAKIKVEKQKVDAPSTSYRNMIDTKSDIFASIDKIIPRPAKSFDDNPLYLCLRMGQPIVAQSTNTRVTPIMNYGRKLKSEYWFSIPRARVDSLYWFLLRWAPDRYDEVYDVDFSELGFLPVDEGEEHVEVEEESQPPVNARTRSASWAFPWRRRKSQDVQEKSQLGWEFVEKEDFEKEVSLTPSESSLPELLAPSNILQEEHIVKITENLPARAIGYAWGLIYSTSVHGFSLKTMYREMANYQSPVLIVIASTTGPIFGAMLSSPLRISDHFYGTGETFLFSFYPEFKLYNWSGENPYFIKGNTGSFAVGASDGHFGLWVDDDLFHGCSKECGTFLNSPLCDSEDFIIKALEAWGFI